MARAAWVARVAMPAQLVYVEKYLQENANKNADFKQGRQKQRLLSSFDRRCGLPVGQASWQIFRFRAAPAGETYDFWLPRWPNLRILAAVAHQNKEALQRRRAARRGGGPDMAGK